MGVITKIGWGGEPWPSKLIFSSVFGRPCRCPLILFLSGLPKSGLGRPTEDPRKTHGCLRRHQGPNPGSEGARPTRSKHVINNVLLARGVRKSWALGVLPRLKGSKLCERVYKSRVWVTCKYLEPPTKPTISYGHLQFPYHTDLWFCRRVDDFL